MAAIAAAAVGCAPSDRYITISGYAQGGTYTVKINLNGTGGMIKVPAETVRDSVDAILQNKDILERERDIDDLYWDKLDSLSELHYFDMNVILAFIVKLHIIDRWHLLDEQTGREMFKKLVDEIRGTFRGVRYDG